MRAARIVATQRQGLDELIEELRAAGYAVEVTAPEQDGSDAADLRIEVECSPAAQALESAARLAQQGYDVFIASGLTRPEAVLASPAAEASTAPEWRFHAQGAVPAPIAAQAELPAEPARGNGSSVGAALFTSWQRISSSWSEYLRKRAVAAEQRRSQRELREQEREARREQEALELRHRLAEEERMRAERLRLEREQMAREAAIAAERALQAEQERRRIAELETERARLAQQRERDRQVAIRTHTQPPAARPRTVQVAAAAPSPTAMRSGRPVYPPRRIPSPRQQQWQRAAFLASLVALTAMLGFAAALTLRPASPLPTTVLQNKAQQSVPFGSANMPASATPAPVRPAPAAAAPLHKPEPAAQKPSPQRTAHRTAERPRHAYIAHDEVVVRRYPVPRTQGGQSADTVRRFSDEN